MGGIASVKWQDAKGQTSNGRCQMSNLKCELIVSSGCAT